MGPVGPRLGVVCGAVVSLVAPVRPVLVQPAPAEGPPGRRGGHAGDGHPGPSLVPLERSGRARAEVAVHGDRPGQRGGQAALEAPHRRTLRPALEHRPGAGREQRRPGPLADPPRPGQPRRALESPGGCAGAPVHVARRRAGQGAGAAQQAVGGGHQGTAVAAVQGPVVPAVGGPSAHGRGPAQGRGGAEVDVVAVDRQPRAAVRRAHVEGVLVDATVGLPAGSAQPVPAEPGVAPAVGPGEPDGVGVGVAAPAADPADGRDAGADAGVDPRPVAGTVQGPGPGAEEVQGRRAAAGLPGGEPLEVVPERGPRRETQRPGRRAGATSRPDALPAGRGRPGGHPGAVARAGRLRADPDGQHAPAVPGLPGHPPTVQVLLRAGAQGAADVDADAEERRVRPPAVHHPRGGCPAGVEGVAAPGLQRPGAGTLGTDPGGGPRPGTLRAEGGGYVACDLRRRGGQGGAGAGGARLPRQRLRGEDGDRDGQAHRGGQQAGPGGQRGGAQQRQGPAHASRSAHGDSSRSGAEASEA